ncbi:MAG: OmpA family protein [Nitrospira sp.]
MRPDDFGSNSGGQHSTTHGLMDLMTSLAVIFILLLAASLAPRAEREEPTEHPTPTSVSTTVAPADGTIRVRTELRDLFAQFGLAVDEDPLDPLVMRIVIPEDLLNFNFGESTLTPQAERFLTEMMPRYATVLCGPISSHIESVVIEGHTDDRGDDTLNLRLSQERSFRVMIKGLDVIEHAAPSATTCFQRFTSASGRGRQDLVYDPVSGVNRDKSRRVVFKLRLRSGEAVLSQFETAPLTHIGVN